MLPFLRIPPFPGHRAAPVARPHPGPTKEDAADVADALRRARVGGLFWGRQATLPKDRDVVLCPSEEAPLQTLVELAEALGLGNRIVAMGKPASSQAVPSVADDCDPWSLCPQATHIIAGADHEIALVAALGGTKVTTVGNGPYAGATPEEIVERAVLQGWSYRNPFDGKPASAAETIGRLGRWRHLIDENRQAAGILGIARWKRVTADAMLWDGTGPVRHSRRGIRKLRSGDGKVLAWISRSDARSLTRLRQRGVTVGEIEDGMIRSTGLGANCVPPLSIVVDFAGPHFDPAQASTLETLLQTAEIDEPLIARAAALRERLVSSGISKYGQDNRRAQRPDALHGRRRVLVTGQVEDDRSVLRGGGGLGNLELLRRTRADEPDAHLIFKPHPDVEAGHRAGAVPDAQALEIVDEIDRTSSIAALLDQVDAVHVLTSLAGFEALMRGRAVTTHGVPFFAGWGLTRDLGPVPARRNRQRTLDELVAATLLLYPRYLDPVTRLPCEAELLVERMSDGQATVRSPLVLLRELQGRLNRLARHLPFPERPS